MPPKLGILAGGGDLPPRLIESCLTNGREIFVIAFDGQAEPKVLFQDTGLTVPHAWVRLGAAGKTLNLLKKSGVTELVMVGSIKRPGFRDLMPDLWATKFFAKSGAAALGDDGLLTALIKALEGEGFSVVGIDELLPETRAPEGPFGSLLPDSVDTIDIRLALEAALEIGAQDIGQGAIARGGVVIAREDVEGTDAMLSRVSSLPTGERSGVLVKVSKPGQEKRADLPIIGVHTVRAAAAAGLRGIAVQAGAALVIGYDDVVVAADACGLFVTGINPGKIP